MIDNNDEMEIVNASYVWKIRNFCRDAKTKQELFSPVFHTNTLLWQLSFSPYRNPENVAYNSIHLHSRNNIPVKAGGNLSILDNENQKYGTAVIRENTVFPPNSGFSWKQFIEEDVILNANNNIITNDTLTIFCEITVNGALYNNLKTSEHSKLLLDKQKNFSEFLKNDELSDVLLVVDNKEIPAHKILLVNKSPVFKAMFSHEELVENQLNVVAIDDIDVDVLEEMLHFIYDEHTFKIVTEGFAEKLLIAGDRYEITDLVETCEKYLSDKLSVDNVIRVLSLAFTCNANNLKTKALNFLSVNAKEVQHTPDFVRIGELHADLIAEIMSVIINKN